MSDTDTADLKPPVQLPQENATVRLEPATPLDSGHGDIDSSVLTQYSIIDKIGGGGMGVVYLAKDRRLGRYVAIKRLSSSMQVVTALRHRFMHEARAVAALNHIHIVHVYELGEDDDGPYIVMEYVAGPGKPQSDGLPCPSLTLEAQVANNGQMSVNNAIDLLVKIGKAIAYAHSCGVIHRDLKPSNILLDPQGEPKIVDFGLARLKQGDESHITAPGEKLLSLGYGAPEQEQDASVSDERADVYGLGALLYFAITGQNPRYFREQDIPISLREVLVKALATDRERRWSSAAEFTDALSAIQSRTRIEMPTVKTTWRCKWCDTVNPLTIHYCAECGWDGAETCPECGAETFFGIQFCPTCGADARTYETESGLLRRAQMNLDAGRFEKSLAYATRAQGFEPAGPTGRQMVKTAQELRSKSERLIARRDALRGLVAQETRAENFERARAFILELRKLSHDDTLFALEEQQIPALIRKRDTQRASRAISEGDWRTARDVVDRLLHDGAKDDPECRALQSRIKHHIFAMKSFKVFVAIVAVALVYVLSLAPASLAFPQGGTIPLVYRPALALHKSGLLAHPLQTYAAWWGIDEIGAPQTPFIEPFSPIEFPEIRSLRDSYAQQLAELKGEQDRFDASWPEEYLRELDALAERRRAAGDYEPLVLTRSERSQFDSSRAIGEDSPKDFPELAALKQKFRQLSANSRVDYFRRLVNLATKYQNDLSSLLKNYTKENRLAEAEQVNQEIQRIREDAMLQEAETVLAEYASSNPDEPTTATLATVQPAADSTKEFISSLRDEFEKHLAEIDDEYERNLEAWPVQYLENLKRVVSDYRAKGDYGGTLAAQNEMERFEIYVSIRERDSTGLPEPLVNLQRQFIDLYNGYCETRAHRVADLAEQQIATLKQRQAEFVRSDDMESASQIESEIRQIRARQEVIEANEILFPHPDTDASTAHE